ncbi:DUF4380 domain-containing protein [Phycicoccus sp. Soil802]|uniref:DUF4380 domain-containing protein n=1 Tax=Phycicoccus sp. Soil802 TaxID=1736414 RepID=UPI000B05F33B|nr:DUF4380 domain-containing protein [Phycicoccus sp. Soil802]
MTSASQVSVVIDDGTPSARPDVVWLNNGQVRLGFVPALGGRLLSVTVAGEETLWRNAALLDDQLHPVEGHNPAPTTGKLRDWNNYGGDKTWPAPQGWSGPDEWPGPPDPILDSGPYAWRVDRHDSGAVSLEMTSEPDPRTGLRLVRTFTVAPSSSAYDLLLEAHNSSSRMVTWALWNVTQRRAGSPDDGGVILSIEPGGEDAVPLVVGTVAPEHEVLQGGRVLIRHQRVVGKLGFPYASGWIAHLAGGTTSTIQFSPEVDASYPDRGSRAEVWMETPLPRPLANLGGLRPAADIVELEVLGPLRRLSPRESMTMRLRCAATVGQPPDIESVHADGHMSSQGWTSYGSGHCLGNESMSRPAHEAQR